SRSAIMMDTLKQVTNQYDCAFATVYDPASATNITVLMGGIGKFQYHPETGLWEDGDRGIPLPFVRSITQMRFQNGRMSQRIQLPPYEQEMPGFIGASAIFFPRSELLYRDGIIDYRKLINDSMAIGICMAASALLLPL